MESLFGEQDLGSGESMEYLIAIEPLASVYQYVVDLKKAYKNNFGEAKYVNGKPHISIVNFCLNKLKEHKLIELLQDEISQFPSMSLTTNNLQFFQGNGLFSLALTRDATELLQPMHQAIRRVLFTELSIRKIPAKMGLPHITIAMANSRIQYEASKAYFTSTDHSECFSVKEMKLLHRSLVNRESEELRWIEVAKIPLR